MHPELARRTFIGFLIGVTATVITYESGLVGRAKRDVERAEQDVRPLRNRLNEDLIRVRSDLAGFIDSISRSIDPNR